MLQPATPPRPTPRRRPRRSPNMARRISPTNSGSASASLAEQLAFGRRRHDVEHLDHAGRRREVRRSPARRRLDRPCGHVPDDFGPGLLMVAIRQMAENCSSGVNSANSPAACCGGKYDSTRAIACGCSPATRSRRASAARSCKNWKGPVLAGRQWSNARECRLRANSRTTASCSARLTSPSPFSSAVTAAACWASSRPSNSRPLPVGQASQQDGRFAEIRSWELSRRGSAGRVVGGYRHPGRKLDRIVVQQRSF